MTAALEIHGFKGCPFAFRCRIAATEKGVSFDWIPCDVPEPDPRAATHNPNRRSPLLWQDGFVLTDSLVIAQYLDEAFEGPPLQPRDPKERAQMRMTQLELSHIKVDGRPGAVLSDAAKAGAEVALRALEGKLTGPWLGGDQPSLADIEIWPFLAVLRLKGILQLGAKAADYWNRVQTRDSFRATNPFQG